MKKAIEIVEYFTAIANAVSKGIKTVVENWPSNSPFGDSDAKNNSAGNV